LVVLVGEGTASAAEIFAGAIQDHDIGMIVGTQTWGKGLVQTVYSLSYGAGLALTTAKYYTPSGRLIQRDYTSWFDYSTHSNAYIPGESEVEMPVDDEAEAIGAFMTDLGRKVYGGGGITPDIMIEPPELSSYLQLLLAKNAFFDFAVSFVNTHPIADRSWQLTPAIEKDFRSWLVEQGVLTSEELEEALAQPGLTEQLPQYLHAEIFNAAFGIEARYEILANADTQIQRALQAFGEAGELLARRQALEELTPESSPAATSSLN